MRAVKYLIIKNSVKKRNKRNTFDNLQSEHFQLEENAGLDQNNSYYFSAHSETYSLFARLGKRGGGAHEVWFAYYNKNGDAYVNSETIYNKDNCPLTLSCVAPLKEWTVSYNGTLKKCKAEGIIMQPEGEDLKANFSGTFHCEGELYEFSRDTSPIAFARAVSEERWSKEFFSALSSNTQVHTEQSGRLNGKLTVGSNDYEIDCAAMRDHSFGKREWGYMNRHIWLMAVSDNRHLNVNMVSYPALKGLRTGYHSANGKVDSVTNATAITELGTKGMPSKFEYYCALTDKSFLSNKCSVEAVFPFQMGGAYTIYEGVASYEIDGSKARGIAEFGYNIDETRWN